MNNFPKVLTVRVLAYLFCEQLKIRVYTKVELKLFQGILTCQFPFFQCLFDNLLNSKALQSVETYQELIKSTGEEQINLDENLDGQAELHGIISGALSSVRIMKDGLEIKFLEVFSNLFKTAFNRCDYEIDFEKNTACSKLAIEGQIKKLKKQDLIDFSALLLAISTGQISASCKVVYELKNRRYADNSKEATVYFGVNKRGKPHIVFTEFGWKLIVASHFQFALAQYAVRHKIFDGYVQKLHKIYDENYVAVTQVTEDLIEEVEELEKEEKEIREKLNDDDNEGSSEALEERLNKIVYEDKEAMITKEDALFENLKTEFNNLASSNVLRKFWEQESSREHASHVAVFFDVLKSYGHNCKELSWELFSPVLKSIYLNGIALRSNPGDDDEKNEVCSVVFSICLMAYISPIAVEEQIMPAISQNPKLNLQQVKALQLLMSMAGEIAGFESNNADSEEGRTSYPKTCF